MVGNISDRDTFYLGEKNPSVAPRLLRRTSVRDVASPALGPERNIAIMSIDFVWERCFLGRDKNTDDRCGVGN
jgi:hypothetical protein